MSPVTPEMWESLRRCKEASERQRAFLDALVEAMPEGMSREDVLIVARRFLNMVEELQPRQGLMRFSRMAIPKPKGKGVAVRPISEHERYRRLRGYSITSLAAAIDRSRLWVSRIENGHERPSADYRRDVARVLRVPEELIFGDAASNGSERKQDLVT